MNTNKKTLEKNFNFALKNHQMGDLNQAKKTYNIILNTNPNHINSLNNLAIIFAQLKKYQDAEILFKKAIKINPNYVEAYTNLGNLFNKLGDNKKAKKYFDKALKINLTNSSEKSLFVYNEVNHRGFFLESGLDQIKNKQYQLPLLTWPFLDFMKTLDVSKNIIHELGSGNSTIWFSKIFKEILSYETNKLFYNSLKNTLEKKEKNISINLINLEDIYNCQFKFKSNDWLLIDFPGKRTKFVQKLVYFSDTNIPAQIIFDNSESYRNGAKILVGRGYFEIPFYGFKSGESIISCTSLFLLKNKFKIKILEKFYYPEFSKKINNAWDKIDSN